MRLNCGFITFNTEPHDDLSKMLVCCNGDLDLYTIKEIKSICDTIKEELLFKRIKRAVLKSGKPPKDLHLKLDENDEFSICIDNYLVLRIPDANNDFACEVKYINYVSGYGSTNSRLSKNDIAYINSIIINWICSN